MANVRADVAEPDLATWYDLDVRQLMGLVGSCKTPTSGEGFTSLLFAWFEPTNLESVRASSSQKIIKNMSVRPRWPYEHVIKVEYSQHEYDSFSYGTVEHELLVNTRGIH